MFNCHVHGWSHIEKPCSICNPIHIWTSSVTTVEAFVAISKSELDRLKSENARFKEALLKIDAYDPATYDGLTSYSYKLIAREALKGGE